MSLDTTRIEGQYADDTRRLGADKANALRSLRMYRLVMDDRQRRVRLAAKAGISQSMTAREMGISVRTVKRDLFFGRKAEENQ